MLEPTLVGTEGQVFKKSKVILGILTVSGLAALTPMIFKGQLYIGLYVSN